MGALTGLRLHWSIQASCGALRVLTPDHHSCHSNFSNMCSSSSTVGMANWRASHGPWPCHQSKYYGRYLLCNIKQLFKIETELLCLAFDLKPSNGNSSKSKVQGCNPWIHLLCVFIYRLWYFGCMLCWQLYYFKTRGKCCQPIKKWCLQQLCQIVHSHWI